MKQELIKKKNRKGLQAAVQHRGSAPVTTARHAADDHQNKVTEVLGALLCNEDLMERQRY